MTFSVSTPAEVQHYLERALAHPEQTELLPLSSDTDAQVIQDEIWRVLDSPALPRAAGSIVFFTYRNQLRRLSVKVAIKHDKFPTLLVLQGVQQHVDGEQHGAGGFADVYSGTYRGSKVALKVLRTFPTMSDEEIRDTKKAFYRESLLWKGLSHDHVLSFIGIAEDVFPGKLCMVIPWMEHGNLRHHINTLILVDGTLSGDNFEKTMVPWLHQTALGLAYLHAEGIVHGDLHGGNILVAEDGSVRLTDFGLSLIAEGTAYNYGSHHGGGATRWSAPELFDPEAFSLQSTRPTFRSDVYAFACTIIELYTNKRPFADLSDHQIPLRVVRGDRPPRPRLPVGREVSDAVWVLTQSCWHQRIMSRPSADEVAGSLVRIMNPPPLISLPPLNAKVQAYIEYFRTEGEKQDMQKLEYGPRVPSRWLEQSMQQTIDFYINGPRENLTWLLVVGERALIPPNGVQSINIDAGDNATWSMTVYAGRQWHYDYMVSRDIHIHKFDSSENDEEFDGLTLRRRVSASREYVPQQILVASPRHVRWVTVSGSFSLQTLASRGIRPIDVSYDPRQDSYATLWRDSHASTYYPWESLWNLRAPSEQGLVTAQFVERRETFAACTFEAYDFLSDQVLETFEILCHTA